MIQWAINKRAPCMGRNTFKFFYKVVQKKKNMKHIYENVLPTLKTYEEVDQLPVPKWSKPYFRYEFATKVLGLPTMEQILLSMQNNNIEIPKFKMYRYNGEGVINVGVNPIDVETGDYVTIISDELVTVNHHPVKVKCVDTSILDYIGEYTYQEKIDVISAYLGSKYS